MASLTLRKKGKDLFKTLQAGVDIKSSEDAKKEAKQQFNNSLR